MKTLKEKDFGFFSLIDKDITISQTEKKVELVMSISFFTIIQLKILKIMMLNIVQFGVSIKN